jgi:hypothetical protein
MDNQRTLSTLDTQDTERKQAKQKEQHRKLKLKNVNSCKVTNYLFVYNSLSIQGIT